MSFPFPEKIPITRMEDYHTHHLGHTSDGRQFFGYATFVFPNKSTTPDWLTQRSEYAVLYIFDAEGNHLETRSKFAGFTANIRSALAEEMVETMVNELGEFEYGDIEVKPFSSVIDGITFGLIPDNTYVAIDLQPSSTISFQEPWDGEYYT